MMLLEHDAKVLLASLGVPVPKGHLVEHQGAVSVSQSVSDSGLGFPYFVKAQVPVGGRGKAGGVLRVENSEQAQLALVRLLGSKLKGHQIRGCRLEAPASGQECYVSLMLDAASGEIVILMSESGGVEIESHSAQGQMLKDMSPFDDAVVSVKVKALAQQLSSQYRAPIIEAAQYLIQAFFQFELTLVEINPLFVQSDGSWVAGDAKLVADDNAIERQPRLLSLLKERGLAYPEASLKIDHGFDFVRIDEAGDVGLLTTGAGLSMQLVDELTRKGCRPFNFCDIRTGQFRGEPTRLIQTIRWIGEGKQVKVILMNFFAGVTDLGELSRLFLAAREQTADIKIPIVIRLIGNGLDAAIKTLAAADASLVVETDLALAVDRVVAIAKA
jgi:succinyl-CoA synthetase beta subunit